MRRYGGSTRLERRPAEGQTRLNTRRRLLPLKQSTRRAGEGRWCQAAAQAGCREREGREGRQAWAGAHRRINLEGEKECAVRACAPRPRGGVRACVATASERSRGGRAGGGPRRGGRGLERPALRSVAHPRSTTACLMTVE